MAGLIHPQIRAPKALEYLIYSLHLREPRTTLKLARMILLGLSRTGIVMGMDYHLLLTPPKPKLTMALAV